MNTEKNTPRLLGVAFLFVAVALAVRGISAFSLLNVSQEFAKAGAPDSSYFQTLGSLFYGTTQFSYSVLMVFFIVWEAYCFTPYSLNQNMFQ